MARHRLGVLQFCVVALAVFVVKPQSTRSQPPAYQPIVWSHPLGESSITAPLTPFFFDNGNILFLATDTQLLAWDYANNHELLYNHTALSTMVHCSFTTIGCGITDAEVWNSTHVLWYSYDTVGIVNAITGEKGYAIESPGNKPLSAFHVFTEANLIVTVFSPTDAITKLCAYHVENGVEAWCNEVCASRCRTTVGDLDTLSNNLFVATSDFVMALSTITGSITWKRAITDSRNSNGPVLLPNRTAVLFVDGANLNVYSLAHNGTIVNQIPIAQDAPSSSYVSIYAEDRLLVVNDANMTNFDLLTMDVLSYNSTGITGSQYLVVNGSVLYMAATEAVYAFSLTELEEGALWVSGSSGSFLYVAAEQMLAIATGSALLTFVHASNGSTIMTCAVEGSNEPTTVPAYRAQDDTFSFATQDNFVGQCIGRSVLVQALNSGYSWAGMTVSEGGNELIVTPSDWQAGFATIDIASMSIIHKVTVRNQGAEFAAYATGLVANCGPNNSPMVYLTMEEQLDTTQQTNLYAFYKNSATVAWHVDNITIFIANEKDCMIYVGDENNVAYKYSATTGALQWSKYVVPNNNENMQGFSLQPVFGSVTDHVYYLSDDSTLMALSITTGDVVWSVILYAPLQKIFQPIATPMTYNGKVYVSHPNNGMFYQVDEATGTINYQESYPVYFSPVQWDNKIYVCLGAVTDYGVGWFDVSLSQMLYMHLSEGQFDLQGPQITPDGVLLMVNEALYVVYLPQRRLLWSHYGGESLQAQFGTNGYVFGMFFGVQVFNAYTGEYVMNLPHDSSKINTQIITLSSTTSNVDVIVLQSNQIFKYNKLPLPPTVPPTLPPNWTPFPAPSPGSPAPTPGGGATPSPGVPPATPSPGGPAPPPDDSSSGIIPTPPATPNPLPPPGDDSSSGSSWNPWNQYRGPYRKPMSTSYVGLPVSFAVVFVAIFIVFSIVHKKRYRATGKPSEEMLAEILVIHHGTAV